MGIKFNTILTTGVALAFFGGINYVSYKDTEREYFENIKPKIETMNLDSTEYKKELKKYLLEYETGKRQNIASLEFLVEENIENKKYKIISKCTGKAVKIIDYVAIPGRKYFLYEKLHKNELKEKYSKMKNSLFNRKINNNSKQ